MRATKIHSGEIVVTLENDKEKHVLWHLLNNDDSVGLLENSEHLDVGVFDEVSFKMFDEYDRIASDMEKLPEELQTVSLYYRREKDGKHVYQCPLCRLHEHPIVACRLCRGSGEIFIDGNPTDERGD